MTSPSKKATALILVFALPLTTPAAFAALSSEQCNSQSRESISIVDANPQDAQRAILVQHLISQGTPPEQAQTLVASLTADDVNVLAENPQMLQLAGDGNDVLAAVGVVFLILLLIGLVAAAAAGG